ncbi:hypothetical protein [Kitasatospora griseola]|uniref:hypothetical protein n=1 Tax=Kitasatospora griseola TaxID=2064 RepID=UPI00381D34EE
MQATIVAVGYAVPCSGRPCATGRGGIALSLPFAEIRLTAELMMRQDGGLPF